jgi:hypothetical protein
MSFPITLRTWPLPPSIVLCLTEEPVVTQLRPILLAEDDPNDAELTLAAFKKHNVLNEVVVVSDGADTLVTTYERGVNGYVVQSVNFTSFVSAVQKRRPLWGMLNKPLPKTHGKACA